MSLLFTRNEFDRLVLIKEILEELANSITYKKVEYSESVPIEIRSQIVKAYLSRRDEFKKRFDIYRHQLFLIVNADDWKTVLNEWVDRICPDRSSDEHYYRDLYSLYVYVNNIISTQYPSSNDPILRMVLSILEQLGYEKGFEVIIQLHEIETNELYKKGLSKWIEKYNLILPWWTQLVGLFKSEKIGENVNNWITLNSFSTDQAYEILCQFHFVVQYSDETKNDSQLHFEVEEVLERLWKQKSK